MGDTRLIHIENLSKQYRLGRHFDFSKTFREILVDLPKRALLKTKILGNSNGSFRRSEKSNKFLALKGVSFDVEPGETLGIIGRNGSGKTTLLKILSRVTPPTTGTVDLFGRVGSLLEVGTGFHPELTGRENVYLSGAILGMRKTEISRRFEEIVQFAEIAKFVDTPVKRYSSGMVARLGFSVASHLNSDIMLVDELLSTADASFQRKCLEKIEAVSRSGRTVLFVSHNLPAINRLCSRVIRLDAGRLISDGPPRAVIADYLSEISQQPPIFETGFHVSRSAGILRVSIKTESESIVASGDVSRDSEFTISVLVEARRAIPRGYLVVTLHDVAGRSILTSDQRYNSLKADFYGFAVGRRTISVLFPKGLLSVGKYFCTVQLADSEMGLVHKVDKCLSFSISGLEDDNPIEDVGFFTPSLAWRSHPKRVR